MEYFRLHFFKEKTRQINVEAIVAFFEAIEGFEIEMDEKSVRFNYNHPRLNYSARFLIMQKSQVDDIYRLDPRFLDINFQLELPILSPDYFANELFLIAKRLVDKFDYFVYNRMFENVLPFKTELVSKVFNMQKEQYLELNPKLLHDYNLISKEKFSSILRYMDDILSLTKFYKESETYVPHYYFLKNNDGVLKVAFEWKYDTLTVIPPYIDYIFINKGTEANIIRYDEFLAQSNKFLEDVPGFLRDTKVVPKKNMKKINKIIKKNKFTKVLEVLTKVEHFSIID